MPLFVAKTKHPDGRIRVDDILDFTGGVQNTPIYWNQIQNKPSTFPPSYHTHQWNDITNPPSQYPPEPHTHTKANITDLETITTTPTANAIPKADNKGKINIKWLDLTRYNTDLNQYRTNWLFHPEGLKNIEFDIEVLDVIKLPIPQWYPGDQVYGEFIHVDLVYNPDGILAPDGDKYPFWIAYSPFPSLRAEYENPCVAYSKDGITWYSDFTLPLIEMPGGDYNSDPELFELDDGRLCLINRQYGSNYNLQFMIYTPNSGWSNPVTFASSNQDVLKCPSVVKDTKCGEREFVLFTTKAYTNLRRQTLTFSEDYSSATIGDTTVCNVIDVDTGNSIASDHINIKFLNNQYVGIVLNGNYKLYWVVSLDGYNFYAKKIIFNNEIISRGFPYRADFIIQENGTILLYLPFVLYSGGAVYNPFLFLVKIFPRLKTNIKSILQPSYIASCGATSGNGYPSESKVYYYLSFVDKSGKESNKFYIGMVTSASSFNVNISINTDVTSAYKYRLYRSYNSDSMLNITDVYSTLLNAGDSIVDNNSNWTQVGNVTIAGTGGKVLGYDETDGYIFTNKGIKVGETTRPPFVIESTSLVQNLNADLLDGHHASEFMLISGNNTFPGNNTFTGTNLFKPTTDSTTAFRVQKSDGSAVFCVDTTNKRVGIGTESPTCPLSIAVGGVEKFKFFTDGLNSYLSIYGNTTANVITLRPPDYTVAYPFISTNAMGFDFVLNNGNNGVAIRSIDSQNVSFMGRYNYNLGVNNNLVFRGGTYGSAPGGDIIFRGGDSTGTQKGKIKFQTPDGTSDLMIILPNGYIGMRTSSPTSPFHINGSVAFPVTTTTSNLTLTDTHYTVLVDATSSGVTITLPSASGIDGRIYVVKKIDSSVNTVTIQSQSGQTIDGASSITLLTQYATVVVQAYSGNWYVVGKINA